GALVEGEGRGPGFRRVMRAVVVEQARLVLAQVAKRRHREREDRQSVIQVGAESAFANLLAQVAVGGGDDARAAHARLRLADALVLAVLEHAQELRLQLERQLADLVEEERALAGVLEVSRLRLRRSGEGALRVSE